MIELALLLALGAWPSSAPLGNPPVSKPRFHATPVPEPPSGCSSPASWSAASSLPNPAYRYGFAQDGSDFYLVAVGATYRYDSNTDLWTTLAPMPRPLQMPGVAYHDGKLYAAGGMDDGPSNDFFIYDIVSNTWTTGPSMPVFSFGSAAGAYAGKVFAISGVSGQSLVIYDIATQSWTIGTSPPVAYRIGGSTQVGQYLYLVGSLGSNGNNVSRRLDMATGTWTTGPPWTPARGDFALTSDGIKLYALGGRVWNQSVPSAEVHELDLAGWPAGQWTRRLPDLPSAREANQAGFSTAGRVWTTGGYGAGPTYTLDHLFLKLDGCMP